MPIEHAKEDRYRIADGVVDLEQRVVLVADRKVRLTPLEVRILAYMVGRPGEIVTREELERDVWAYQPGVRSEAVRMGMHRLQGKLEGNRDAPRTLESIRGVGWRLWLAPVDTEDELFGRGAELGALWQHLDAGDRLVVLVGPGGVGKTRLARAFLERWRTKPEGPAWFCDLSSARSLDTAVERVAQALGVAHAGPEGTRELIGESVALRGRALVVLDNAEQIPGAVTALVSAWMRVAPEAVFLVTSRSVLSLAGARVLRVERLPRADATALFVHRARRADPGFAVAEAEREVLAEVVEQLEGMPLAIELAAARVSIFSLRAIHDRLEQRLRLLVAAARHVERHRTIRDTIRWSWELLDPDERDALVQCAVFPGTFPVEAAEAVVRLDGAQDVATVLQRLRGHSLLSVERDGEHGLSISPTVREFLAPELARRPEVRGRHLDWTLRWGEALLQDHLVHGRDIQALEEHAADIVDAMELAEQTGRIEELARLALVSNELRTLRGAHTLGADASRAAPLESLPLDALSERTRCRVRLQLGRALSRTGRREEGLEVARRALGEIRRLDDERLEVQAVLVVALCLVQVSRPAEAVTLLRETLAGGGPGDEALRGHLWSYVGFTETQCGRFVDAESSLQVGVDLLEAAGHSSRLAWALSWLAGVYRIQGRLDECLAVLRQAHEAARRAGDRRLECQFPGRRATVLAYLGRGEEAEAAFLESIQGCLEVGLRDVAALFHADLSEFYRDGGRLADAEDHLCRALRMHRRAGNTRLYGVALLNRGLLRRERGDLERAAEDLRQAVEVLEQCDHLRGLVHGRAALATTLADLGHPGQARDLLALAETGLEQVNSPITRAWVDLCRGHVALAGAHPDGPERGRIAALLESPEISRAAESDIDVRLARQELGRRLRV